MFTGIIKKIGKVKTLKRDSKGAIIYVEVPKDFSKQEIGNSIAVDGACLTVTKIDEQAKLLEFFVMHESLSKTVISSYKTGTIVNLETPLKVGDELHGHMVQGHIDFVAKVLSVKADGDSKILEINFSDEFSKHIAVKGSVTINGVSLTVSKLHQNSFEVSLIPETQKDTNLGNLKKDAVVNVEIDIISRYLDRLLQDKEKQTTYEFLKERNFI